MAETDEAGEVPASLGDVGLAEGTLDSRWRTRTVIPSVTDGNRVLRAACHSVGTRPGRRFPDCG